MHAVSTGEEEQRGWVARAAAAGERAAELEERRARLHAGERPEAEDVGRAAAAAAVAHERAVAAHDRASAAYASSAAAHENAARVHETAAEALAGNPEEHRRRAAAHRAFAVDDRAAADAESCKGRQEP